MTTEIHKMSLTDAFTSFMVHKRFIPMCSKCFLLTWSHKSNFLKSIKSTWNNESFLLFLIVCYRNGHNDLMCLTGRFLKDLFTHIIIWNWFENWSNLIIEIHLVLMIGNAQFLIGSKISYCMVISLESWLQVNGTGISMSMMN